MICREGWTTRPCPGSTAYSFISICNRYVTPSLVLPTLPSIRLLAYSTINHHTMPNTADMKRLALQIQAASKERLDDQVRSLAHINPWLTTTLSSQPLSAQHQWDTASLPSDTAFHYPDQLCPDQLWPEFADGIDPSLLLPTSSSHPPSMTTPSSSPSTRRTST